MRATNRFGAVPFDEEWDVSLCFLAETAAPRIGARPALAHAQEDYARMLLMKRDPHRISELAKAAVSTYRALGMERYAARAEGLIQTGNNGRDAANRAEVNAGST